MRIKIRLSDKRHYFKFALLNELFILKSCFRLKVDNFVMQIICDSLLDALIFLLNRCFIGDFRFLKTIHMRCTIGAIDHQYLLMIAVCLIFPWIFAQIRNKLNICNHRRGVASEERVSESNTLIMAEILCTALMLGVSLICLRQNFVDVEILAVFISYD